MKKCTTISLAIFLGVVLLSANSVAAAVTKLNDIRTGQHEGYTRLVLDAEGSRPLIIGPATAEDVTIVYEQLELTRESSVLFRNMIGAAANVSHHRQAGLFGGPHSNPGLNHIGHGFNDKPVSPCLR